MSRRAPKFPLNYENGEGPEPEAGASGGRPHRLQHREEAGQQQAPHVEEGAGLSGVRLPQHPEGAGEDHQHDQESNEVRREDPATYRDQEIRGQGAHREGQSPDQEEEVPQVNFVTRSLFLLCRRFCVFSYMYML